MDGGGVVELAELGVDFFDGAGEKFFLCFLGWWFFGG